MARGRPTKADDFDWHLELDPRERRRAQNREAQRRFREKNRKRANEAANQQRRPPRQAPEFEKTSVDVTHRSEKIWGFGRTV
ncbi:hypothetical protein KC352_g1629 [Hortaea werneckii]|nr:hypothetical protein KC352_g1629 [Hortaea werneckii]